MPLFHRLIVCGVGCGFLKALQDNVDYLLGSFIVKLCVCGILENMHADVRGHYLIVADVLKLIRTLLELLVVYSALRHDKIALESVLGAAGIIRVFLHHLVEIRAAVKLCDYLLRLGHELFGSRLPGGFRRLVIAVGALGAYLRGIRVVELQQDMLYPA